MLSLAGRIGGLDWANLSLVVAFVAILGVNLWKPASDGADEAIELLTNRPEPHAPVRRSDVSITDADWPGDDGFTPATLSSVPSLLTPGMLIDRFGQDGGHFFSPVGTPFTARGLPYVCDSGSYSVFVVRKPFLVWSGKVAPAFNQPGGGAQIRSDAPVASLLAYGVIAPVIPTGRSPCDDAHGPAPAPRQAGDAVIAGPVRGLNSANALGSTP
jgi:hypothetical protein